MASTEKAKMPLDGYRLATRWLYVGTTVLFGLIGTAAAAMTALSHPLILACAILAIVLTAIAGAFWPAHSRFRMLEIAVLIGALGWGLTAWAGASPAIAFALLLPPAYGIATRKPWWPWGLAAALVLSVSPIVTGIGGRLDDPSSVADQFTGVFFFCAALIVFLATEFGWVAFNRMDSARAAENELAVTRERLRFANELHDLQGHTLLAIKLKAELARRSLERAPEAARSELADIENLVAEVSAQTRQIANGYRTVTLPTELANAEQLLTAAGIHVRTAPAPHGLGGREALIATVIRESVSNILRHSDARTVTIEFPPGAVIVSNDGAYTREENNREGGGTGLASLRDRLQRDGGALDWTRDGDTFTLTARYLREGEHS